MTSTTLPILPDPDDQPVSPGPSIIKPYSIEGFKKVYPRRNILEWSQSKEDIDIRSWNLFLRALVNLYSLDDQDFCSYYQVAGIHGAPFIHWNEVPQPGDRPGNYCTHGSALFLTWHTPYQLLFEQRIVEEALKHASRFHVKYKAQYEEAAAQIRAPYWDFATDYRVPEPTRDPQCDILLPQPNKHSADPPQIERVRNPLYSYQFPSDLRRHRDFAVSRREWRQDYAWQTLRCPDFDGHPQPDIADAQLGGSEVPPSHQHLPRDFRNGIYHLLMNVSTYGAFSNTGWRAATNSSLDPGRNSQNFHSIEAYHNTVHVFTGTDYITPIPDIEQPPDRLLGHMMDTASAAFDPIFWLLHGNIDRLYAMWQAINPQAEFQEQAMERTRLPDIPSLTALDKSDGPLRPFFIRKSNNAGGNDYSVWVNNMVQRGGGVIPNRLFEYGYTYPEIGPEDLSEEDRAAHVRAEAHRLYGPLNENTYHDPEHYPEELSEYKNDIRFRRTWNVVIKVKRALIAHNFTIFFFLGDPGEDPIRWTTHKEFVGSFSTFKGQADYCANCADQDAGDVFMKSALDITDAIYTKLQKTHPNCTLDARAEISKLLENDLTWRVMDHETCRGVDLRAVLKNDSKALKVLPTSFLVPYLKEGPKWEGPYRSIARKLVLTQHEKYESVTKFKKDIGGWEDDD